MTRWTVLSASWGHGEILNEPPCSNLQFLNTSNEKSLAGTMNLNTLHNEKALHLVLENLYTTFVKHNN
ncbi:hypothetical protein N665_0054s0043 [Sinapis alba]|nr:hypothetical protein N665_0054s0043 [Sinapis alba]